jgi:hypothetical protein
MENIMHLAPLQFAPGLMQVFQSSTAPTIAYFKTLPLHLDKMWAVYVLVLEKHGQRPKVYIGSGCHSVNGVRSRMLTYDRRARTGKGDITIAFYVEKALLEGFCVTHRGLLA